MNLLESKKGIGTNMIQNTTIGVVGVVILFLLLAELIPEAQTAGDTLNASGAPLGGLFAGDGVVILIIMAGVLLALVAFFLKSKGR